MRSAILPALFLALFSGAVFAADEAVPAAPPKDDAAGAKPLGLPEQPRFRDGLIPSEMEWRDLAKHPVEVEAAKGEIALQAFLPKDWKLPEDKAVPLGFGVEVRFVFQFAVAAGGAKEGQLGFALTVPKAARKWLKPFAKSAENAGIKQTIEDNTMTFDSSITYGEPWWLTLPVTTAAAPGEYAYVISLGGRKVAEGQFAFAKLSENDRDELQRRITIYFFSRVAYPRFLQWVREHEGRLPTTKEFLKALESLEYFPANDYTAHRGLPKRLTDLEDPGKTWLARECRGAVDGKVVVVYADGSIGLEAPIDIGEDRDE